MKKTTILMLVVALVLSLGATAFVVCGKGNVSSDDTVPSYEASEHFPFREEVKCALKLNVDELILNVGDSYTVGYRYNGSNTHLYGWV